MCHSRSSLVSNLRGDRWAVAFLFCPHDNFVKTGIIQKEVPHSVIC
jgi:hypothetical protein